MTDSYQKSNEKVNEIYLVNIKEDRRMGEQKDETHRNSMVTDDDNGNILNHSDSGVDGMPHLKVRDD